MTELLARFVAAFRRGIEGEVAAMRASAETFELPLTGGEELGGLRYRFAVASRPDRLAAGTVASLRGPQGEQAVAIERIADGHAVIVATRPLDVTTAGLVLVIAPWFLYDRLLEALDRLTVDQHGVALALTLFGRTPPAHDPAPLRCDHAALDPSQRAAVQLCRDRELAFLWGPPGTGKTVTLTHVLEELLAGDGRILLVSTTNAAIDQVLTKLAARPWFAGAVEAGRLIRLGRSDAETFGAELADVTARLSGAQRTTLERLRRRLGEIEPQLRQARAALDALAPAVAAQQALFAESVRPLSAAALSLVFPGVLAGAVATRAARDQQRALTLRATRLERVRALTRARITALSAEARDLASRIAAEARVVMCTLTNAYLSPLLTDQRFDVLIAEEAGMATLPALFYAACLCRRRAIMVGDPRQLPPIVQADDPAVRRAIGRSVFEVTAPDPTRSPSVAMLDVQYRMHPAIGSLVGELFYDGRLHHAADPAVTGAIAARAPFPDQPIAVVDTAGRTTCQRAAGRASRVNPGSAELTASLALEAVQAGHASIAVITPYAAQASEIRRLLSARGIAGAVECSTIHRFQGRECDAVLIDLVDAAPMRPSALLSDAPNLLNVSISRARGKLILIADVAYFTAAAPEGLVAALLRQAAS